MIRRRGCSCGSLCAKTSVCKALWRLVSYFGCGDDHQASRSVTSCIQSWSPIFKFSYNQDYHMPLLKDNDRSSCFYNRWAQWNLIQPEVWHHFSIYLSLVAYYGCLYICIYIYIYIYIVFEISLSYWLNECDGRVTQRDDLEWMLWL